MLKFSLELRINLCIKTVEITKVLAYVMKVILVKPLEILRYCEMSIKIQRKCQIHRKTLKIILITFLIRQCWLILQSTCFNKKLQRRITLS